MADLDFRSGTGPLGVGAKMTPVCFKKRIDFSKTPLGANESAHLLDAWEGLIVEHTAIDVIREEGDAATVDVGDFTVADPTAEIDQNGFITAANVNNGTVLAYGAGAYAAAGRKYLAAGGVISLTALAALDYAILDVCIVGWDLSRAPN